MENTETKVCSKCKMSKLLSHFRFRRDKLIRICWCLECEKEYKKKYRIQNIDKISEYQRKYKKENAEDIKEKDKSYYVSNKENILMQRKKYRDDNADNIKSYQKDYREKNKDKRKVYAKINARKRRKNPLLRIKDALRHRVYLCIKKYNCKKSYKTMELLGCSVDECRKYLENKFLPGMTWENYGKNGWHIDHIIPCNLFDLTNSEEQIKCFHYSNLQPLWETDNTSKQDKVEVFTSEGVFFV